MKKTIQGAIAIAAFMAGQSLAEFPETLVNPAVTLKEIPFGQQLDVGGVGFFPDGRMLLTTTESTTDGAPDPNDGSNVWVVSGVQGDLTGVAMKKIASRWRQPVGAVVTPAGKAYISDRDGFYEILDPNSTSDLANNRKKVIGYPWPGDANVNFTHGASWHQWVFTPTYFNGKFYAPYSGSIQPGGPSATPFTSPTSGAFVGFNADSYGQSWTGWEKIAGGLRSPNGGGVDPDGNMYYADNQGSYVPSSTFTHVRKGQFYGHKQTGNPANWAESMPYEPPTAWLPHGRVRKSPTQPLFLDRGFYKGDWLIGDINDPGLLRIGIDRADDDNDHQNGAVFFFTGGFGAAALNRMAWNTQENSIVVASWGTIAGNWPNGGSKKPTWKMTIADNPNVFEMKGIYSRAGGLLVQFTKPVDKATISAGAFTATQWNYNRSATYGCCQDANESRAVSAATVTNDGMGVFIKIDGIKNNHPGGGGAVTNYVTYLKLGAIKSATGQSLFYSEAWYTLNFQSSKAFDPAAVVAVHPRPEAKLGKAMAYRMQGNGIRVSIHLEGPYRVGLSDLSGKELASQSGRGESEFAFPTPGSRGLYLLRLSQGGYVHSRPIAF